MLDRLYDLFMSLVTMILGFFGIQLGKKSVSFAEDVKDEVKAEESAPLEAPAVETPSVETPAIETSA
jgi:hypothetical protein